MFAVCSGYVPGYEGWSQSHVGHGCDNCEFQHDCTLTHTCSEYDHTQWQMQSPHAEEPPPLPDEDAEPPEMLAEPPDVLCDDDPDEAEVVELREPLEALDGEDDEDGEPDAVEGGGADPL